MCGTLEAEFNGGDIMELRLHMKSGNVAVIRNVKDYRFDMPGDDVVGISLAYDVGKIPNPKILIKTIKLCDIEFVECKK